MLIQNFLINVQAASQVPASDALPSSSEREVVQICVIGSLDGITGIIYDLHRRSFAEVNEWSKPQSTGSPGEYIRLLRRYILHRS